MRLLRVELLRLRWRRAVVLLLTVAVVVPGLVVAVAAWNTRPLDETDRRQAEQLVQEQTAAPQTQRELRRCERRPEQYGAVVDGGDARAACEEMILPRVEWYLERPQLDLRQELSSGSAAGVSIILAMVLVLVGTTFVGHDWNSGSMSNQLLFEPRRARVWATKGAAVALVAAVVATVVTATVWVVLWWLAAHRGLPRPDGLLGDVVGQSARTVVFAAAAAVGGYALTMLFRSTVATLGVLFAAAVLVPLLLTLSGFAGHQQWMPQNNYAAWLRNGYTYTDYGDGACAGDVCEPVRRHLSGVRGGLYYGGLLLLAGVPSVVSFRRRDVP